MSTAVAGAHTDAELIAVNTIRQILEQQALHATYRQGRLT
jgi:hypothetical protein